MKFVKNFSKGKKNNYLHSKNLVVTLTKNLLKTDVAQKVVQGKPILADS
jgi:hypothetical protein